MAGHRSLTAMTLVAASVVPVTFGAVVAWTLLGWEVEAYDAGLLVVAAVVATTTPYALGWLRSLVTLLASTVLLGALPRWLDAAPTWVVVVASIAAVAAIGALAWWSLRVGRVRRPGDAKPWRAAQGDIWPYPYA
jgi:hypothetical protein